MALYELIKNRQHRERLQEILLVFAGEGLGFIISKIKLRSHLPWGARLRARIRAEQATPVPVRLRRAFEQLGPTFVKLGQLLSLRPDLLPSEYLIEFEKMQDKVPAFPFADAKQTLEMELKKPLHRLFSSFSEKPVASASIAQVYRAKVGNKTVAVKVQRPQIRETIETDIQLMYTLAELLETHIPELKNYHLPALIHEFERWTIKELNFRVEAYYAEKMLENSRNSPAVKIPAVYRERSSEKVLTMEFVEGTPLHDSTKIPQRTLRKALKNGYETFLKQAFIDGVFHADPHPGNILILNDGRIGLIDFGIIGQFDRKLKEYTLDLMRAIVHGDYEAASLALMRMCGNHDIDKAAFEQDLKAVFEQFHYASTKDIHLGHALKDLLDIVNKHHLRIPLEFVLFEKMMLTMEGIAAKYQPEANLFEEAKETLGKLLNRQYAARQILRRTTRKISEYQELVETFPETAMELLEKAKQFKLNIEIKDTEVRDLTLEIERSSGNLALGVIIAGLIVASALMLQTSIAEAIPFVGFGTAGILALWLIHRTVFIKIAKR